MWVYGLKLTCQRHELSPNMKSLIDDIMGMDITDASREIYQATDMDLIYSRNRPLPNQASKTFMNGNYPIACILVLPTDS